MERIEVTARFDQEGKIIPMSFVWKQRTYRVDSVGRQWEGDDGYHVLVMTPGNRAYHLLFGRDQGKWYLVNTGDSPTIPYA